MKYLYTSCVLLVAATVQSAEHPSWETLSKLLGKAADSPEVAGFVSAHKLDEITKGPSGAFSSPDQAYTLLYRKGQISSIVVRVAPRRKESSEPHWRAYSGKLPGGLSVDDGKDKVTAKLGKPVESRMNTWRQGDVHIWVHFNQAENGIDELFISPRVIEAREQD